MQSSILHGRVARATPPARAPRPHTHSAAPASPLPRHHLFPCAPAPHPQPTPNTACPSTLPDDRGHAARAADLPTLSQPGAAASLDFPPTTPASTSRTPDSPTPSSSTSAQPSQCSTQSSTRPRSSAPPPGSCSRRTAGLSLSLSLAAASLTAAAAPALLLPYSARASGAAQADPGSSPAAATPPGADQLQPPQAAGRPGAGGGGGAGPGAGPGEGGGAGVKRRERRPVAPVPAVRLAPGLAVSKVIRGCWQLSGRHTGDPATDHTSGPDAAADLAAFHRAGITTLDTADNYGPSESMIGQYFRLTPWTAATTTVATKLSYVTAEAMSSVNRTMVEYAVRGSLARLGRQHLDLVQLQWADPRGQPKWLDVLAWLAELREQGMVGHIGLCNFNVPHMLKAVDSGCGVVSNQVALSLIDRRPQLYMQQAAAAHNIRLLAYGTLAGGLLADKYYNVPAAKVRLDTASKQKYGQALRAAGGAGSWEWAQEVIGAARAVGERHGGASASAVAVAWALAQPQVAAAIVGARNARHIRDLQVACSLRLDDTDMLDLDAVWEGVPQPPSGDVYEWERGGAW